MLEKLILRNGPNSMVPIVMTADMLAAGIDTTSSAISFMLYTLAKNPEAQEKLRQEILSFKAENGNLSANQLGKMPYFKACFKETSRTIPTVGSHARLIEEPFELEGYKIPANTLVMWTTSSMANNRAMFPDAEKFRPERWLKSNPESKQIHPFAILPFSHGPRMCVGKRFAEMEIQVLIAKILVRYRVTWAGSDKPIKPIFKAINAPSGPLHFKFEKI